jgi:hypothetical protein
MIHLKKTSSLQRKKSTDRVPRMIRDAAKAFGWDVHVINSFWTRLKKDDVSIEFRYNLRRETEGRAYVRDVVLTRIFHSQHEIIEYMSETEEQVA